MTARGRRAGATPPSPTTPPPCGAVPVIERVTRTQTAIAERKAEVSVVKDLKGSQDELALKAARVAVLALDKMEEVITKGTDVGQGMRQACPPSALASIYREVRDTMVAPIKQDNEDRGTGVPVTINTNNPEVIRTVIAALREHREEQRLQAARTVEGEVVP